MWYGLYNNLDVLLLARHVVKGHDFLSHRDTDFVIQLLIDHYCALNMSVNEQSSL